MHIRIDDLHGAEIQALLQEHLRDMYATSPPESVHALDLEGLRRPGLTFWSVWDTGQLAGCGALKELDSRQGEIKSMRTAGPFRRRGVAAALLRHIIATAKQRDYRRLQLETGSQAYFAPARQLYLDHGFSICGPFADYREDPNSVFMRLEL